MPVVGTKEDNLAHIGAELHLLAPQQQGGTRFVSSISIGITQTMALSKRYQEFLDNVEAYCYFPLIIAKESNMGDGSADVRAKPISGTIDQAAGLAFAIRDWANYFVFRINGLGQNARSFLRAF